MHPLLTAITIIPQSVLSITHPGAVSSTRGPSMCTRIAEGSGAGACAAGDESVGGVEAVVFKFRFGRGGAGEGVGAEEKEEVKSWSQ